MTQPINSSIKNKEKTTFSIAWIIKITIFLAVILAIATFFIAKNPKPMMLGLLFGTIFSILNFRLLHLTIQKSMDMSPNRAQAYVTSRYVVRYLLVGSMLFVAITNENVNVLEAVIGLIIIKIVIFGMNAYEASTKGLKKG